MYLLVGAADLDSDPDDGMFAYDFESLPSWFPPDLTFAGFVLVAETPEAGKKEFFSSWALFIMIMLLMFALFTSYILQQRKIQAVHETVLSIFAGRQQHWKRPFPEHCWLSILGRHVRWLDYPSESRVAYSR